MREIAVSPGLCDGWVAAPLDTVMSPWRFIQGANADERYCGDPVPLHVHAIVFVPRRTATVPASTVMPVKILQIAPALHGAKVQTAQGTYPVVVWALVENDDGSGDVIGLAVGGKGDSALIGPNPDNFESYNQSG